MSTGGTWDRSDGPIYFLAGNTARIVHTQMSHPYVLAAVNELESEAMLREIEQALDAGARLLIDSGVFWLATSHAKKHGLSMDEALSLAPDQLDDFTALWQRYVEICAKYGNDAWGYVELDQGGAANKRKTREQLEMRGLRPIPVYHPLVDGWEYFDELAASYDRICFGNIVQAPAEVRIRLLTTLHERRRKYPDLWVHLLGFTPNQWLNAICTPLTSADSSTWLASVRWPTGIQNRAMLLPVERLEREFNYRIGAKADDVDDGAWKATRMAAIGWDTDQRNWRHALKRYAEMEAA